jgi:microcystin degradation protein MlrC
MARIAIGGFQHETNTFAPVKAGFADFEMADGWPGLTRGDALFEVFQGINLSLPGFIEEARALRHDLLPLLWCSASPSAHVTRDAYERIVGELVEGVRNLSGLDGIYLDLHGAMVAEHLEDGEGALLERLRAIVGPDLPIVVSLDLHANLTERMVKHASVLVVCRTYPHVDLAETGARAAVVIDRLLQHGPMAKAMRRADFLVPLPWQCTLIDPAAALYENVARQEARNDVGSASFAFGFPPADIQECGPVVVAYGESQEAADRGADQLIGAVTAAERDFAGKIWLKDEAVRRAMAKGRAGQPVILADTQDNPGAGGNSDSVDLLEALVRLGAQDAVFANLYDPETAQIAHEAGLSNSFERAIGAWCGAAGLAKLPGRFKVLALGDGSFKATGAFYRGNHMQLGPMALLGIGGVKIVVTSRKQQAADQAMLRHLGVEPAQQKILALKSSVHFRADFQQIASEILIVAAAGDNPVDNSTLPYRHLRKGVRLMPLGKAFAG